MNNAATDGKKKGNRALTIAIEMAVVLVAVLIGFAIRYGVYYTAIVTSESMESTLQINDRMLVDHRASLSGTWKRGDVVLFKIPDTWKRNEADERDQEEGIELVKRVIGLPGESIEVSNDGVMVAGQKLDEPYLKEKMDTPPVQIVLGEKQYFLMGDNRNNSDDSRANGPVDNNDILGRAVRLVGPLSRFGALAHPNYILN